MSSPRLHLYTQRAKDTVSRFPGTTALTTLLVLSLSWTISDFRAWLAFGTGGTPATWQGYLRMTKFRLLRLLHPADLRDASPLSTSTPSYLTTPLQQRKGPRPRIMARTMPHRQVPEPIDPAARERLLNLMKDLAAQYPHLLTVAPSKTEGGSTDAIYAREDLETLNPVAKKDTLLKREIAHAHPSDNSLHVWMSEADARKVVETGWGERFPLGFVSKGWVMIYAPRSGEEVDVVVGIVRAGVGWVTGVEV